MKNKFHVIGSVRKKEYAISKNVSEYMFREKKNNLDNLESCLKFKKDCEKSRDKIVNEIKKLKSENKKICGYAATSKSTTILNYCNLNYIVITNKRLIFGFPIGKGVSKEIQHFTQKLSLFATFVRR